MVNEFEPINKAYNSVFKVDQLSIGIVVPIENYAKTSVPGMENHIQRVKLVEKLGFKALWLRDVPFHVPSFGDAGQTFDPFTYLGFLAGQTTDIALGIASIALPLHYPVHVAKSATTVDQLSDGRLILGVASGDRPSEYPAMGIDFEKRGELFREAFTYIRRSQDSFPQFSTPSYGNLTGQLDVLPKANKHKIPLLITGQSRQSLEWNAENGDGWMYYPRSLPQQQNIIAEWRDLISQKQKYNKPFMQPLYVDLLEDENALPQGIHLGLRLGVNYLVQYLLHLRDIGVNHVALNLRFNEEPIEETLSYIGETVLPHFHLTKKSK